MKTRQLFLALTLMIFMLSVFSCSTANKELPTTMPGVSREGTSWTLEALIEGQVASSLIDDTEITLQFDGGYARGSAGCNDYGGAYALERGALNISQIDVTEQFCLEPPGIMAQETKYLEILREVTTFIWDANHLTLKTANGPGLRFIATEATAVIPPSGPTDSQELEAFLAVYFTEQMSALHIGGVRY